MRKPEEIKLYALLKDRGSRPNLNRDDFADAFFDDAGCGNRGYYYLEKWSKKGWWDYGYSPRGGWFTQSSPDFLT